jgi:hypothetical protein
MSVVFTQVKNFKHFKMASYFAFGYGVIVLSLLSAIYLMVLDYPPVIINESPFHTVARLIFTGCWDKTEIEDEGYVSAIGIDKGSGRNLRITFQITNPKVVGAGGSSTSSGEIKSEIVTIDATSILTARDLLTVTSTRRITLSHAKVVIAGEEFARNENFFRYIESSLRDKEMRRIMTLMVSKENAEEFIKNNNPLLEDRMQKFYEFMSRRWKETGYVPPFSNLNRFMQRTESGESLFLATYASTKERSTKKGADEGAYFPGQIEKEGGNPAEMIGCSV